MKYGGGRRFPTSAHEGWFTQHEHIIQLTILATMLNISPYTGTSEYKTTQFTKFQNIRNNNSDAVLTETCGIRDAVEADK